MFDSELSIRAVPGRPTVWELTAPLVWTGEQDTFTVPAGFYTDFATVPRFLHWLWLPYGAYTRAAVLHDYLLVALAEWQDASDSGATMAWSPPATSREADGIFRAAMLDLGVPWAKRWTGWAAVRVGALFSRKRSYGRQFVNDAPRVIGMGLLAVPVILPGAVGVLLSLGVVRLVTALSGGAPIARTPGRGRPARDQHPEGT